MKKGLGHIARLIGTCGLAWGLFGGHMPHDVDRREWIATFFVVQLSGYSQTNEARIDALEERAK